jgi:ABC-type multidrug transport system fused ATPase/permease subunit
MVANVAVGCIIVALNLLFVWAGKTVVDLATGDKTWDISHPLLWASVLMIAIAAVRLGLGALNARIESVADAKMTFIMRRRLFSSLLQSQWQGKEKFHSGDALNRLMTDSYTIVSIVCEELPNFVTTVVQFAAAFIFLALLDWRLAVIILLLVPGFVVFSKFFYRKMRRMNKGIRDEESKIQSHIQESLQHRAVIQSMDRGDFVTGQLDDLQQDEYGQILKKAGFSVFSRVLVGTAFTGGYIAAFLWGAVGIANGTITYGIMTAFLQLVGQIQGPSRRISRQISRFVGATTSIDRLMELESSPKEEQGEQIMIPGLLGIRMEEVSYRYPDGKDYVLKDFSWDFKPGSRTAIVGETGAGKSTMIRLMLALLKPDSGKVVIYGGGQEVEASPLTRINMVYVPQGNSLFSGTIRENLLIGDPEATEEEMWKALDTAEAGFVRDLPLGLDSLCGEGGAGLSEGQDQRIAIARGLLRPGCIMLLDEFSSSLDSGTEERLMENLCSGNNDKTMIFITHREKISEYCNSILKLTT